MNYRIIPFNIQELIFWKNTCWQLGSSVLEFCSEASLSIGVLACFSRLAYSSTCKARLLPTTIGLILGAISQGEMVSQFGLLGIFSKHGASQNRAFGVTSCNPTFPGGSPHRPTVINSFKIPHASTARCSPQRARSAINCASSACMALMRSRTVSSWASMRAFTSPQSASG